MAELARRFSSKRAGYIRHEEAREHVLMGNHMAGLATQSMGAREIEVWHSSVEPGACTPVHSHNAEEVIVVLSGKGEARRIGVETIEFEGPCTLILPGNELHQMANTGTQSFESIAIVPIGSRIFDEKGVEMALPWRE
jgi:quercetin dioxygenase-like cupin family protein